MSNIKEKPFYSIKEVAKELGLSSKTAYGIVNRKEIDTIVIGKCIKVTSEELARYKREGAKN